MSADYCLLKMAEGLFGGGPGLTYVKNKGLKNKQI